MRNTGKGLQYHATRPAIAALGDVYQEESTGLLWLFDGFSWKELPAEPAPWEEFEYYTKNGVPMVQIHNVTWYDDNYKQVVKWLNETNAGKLNRDIIEFTHPKFQVAFKMQWDIS